MKGKYEGGRMRRYSMRLVSSAPFVRRVSEEWDVLPDLGLVEGRVYDFDLVNNRAVVRAPRAPRGMQGRHSD